MLAALRRDASTLDWVTIAFSTAPTIMTQSYEGGGRGYYRPGRFRIWNGCQPGWTVQDGLCKPYRGY
jgi:hypothetical protein